MRLLSERLKTIREGRGITQVRAAKALNLTNTTLSNYEKNVSSPSPETLVSMAKYYETTVDYLLGNSDNPLPPVAEKESKIDPELIIRLGSLEDEQRKLVGDLVRMLSAKKS